MKAVFVVVVVVVFYILKSASWGPSYWRHIISRILAL